MNKFLKEIFEQPKALEDTLAYYNTGEGLSALEQISALWKSGKYSDLLFAGMGSSFFAPHTVQCKLSDNGISSGIINGGELLHYHLHGLRKNSLITLISQSGESYEMVKILKQLPADTTSIGITNEEKSTLAIGSKITLLSRAGKEEMTSTKTYISTLLALDILGEFLIGKSNQGTKAEYTQVIEAVRKLIENREEWLAPAMTVLGQPQFVQVIGRGPAYSSVLQGSLMIMEAARNPAAGIFGGEFRHGPMEMIKKGFRAIILAPEGTTLGQSIKLAEDISRSGGRVIFITNSSISFRSSDIFTISIQCNDEYLYPIGAIIPLQFIVNQWATEQGHEPGSFIIGAKVTTTE